MTFEQEKWNIKQYCILDLIALNYLTVLVKKCCPKNLNSILQWNIYFVIPMIERWNQQFIWTWKIDVLCNVTYPFEVYNILFSVLCSIFYHFVYSPKNFMPHWKSGSHSWNSFSFSCLLSCLSSFSVLCLHSCHRVCKMKERSFYLLTALFY